MAEIAQSGRPSGVTITALLWIILGAFSFLSGFLGGVAVLVLERDSTIMFYPETSPVLWIMDLLFRYFAAGAAIQMFFSVLAIWAAIGLLRLKSWARSAIELLCWFLFFWCVCFGVFWVYLWTYTATRGASVPMLFLELLGAIVGFGIAGLTSAPLLIMIRYLRSDEVHTAVEDARLQRT